MKVLKVILTAAVFFLATSVICAQDRRINNRDSQVHFSVNVDCHSCEQKIRRNLPHLDRGVRDLTISIEKQLVTVVYRHNRTNVENLKRHIVGLGFTCEEIKLDNEGNRI